MPAQGSASPSQEASGPAGSDIASVRNATNWRTVQRLVPDLTEILDTSTYSVIYHYDEAGGKWEKQKQEGPLFVVRRGSKTPECALFMLNRQAVKNVTIPLYPGEMKATAIDPSMLQVARRGEKIRYGIWFTEGTETVQRFRDTIFKIVGEPSKNAGAARASPTAAAQTQAAPAAAAAAAAPPPAAPSSAEDGLSRLFAGLTTIPAGSLPQSQSQSQSQSPQPPVPSQQHHQQQQPPQQQQQQYTPHQQQQQQPQQHQHQQFPPPNFPGAQGFAPPTHQLQPYPAAYAQYQSGPPPGSPGAQPQHQQQSHSQYQHHPPPPVISGLSAPVVTGLSAPYKPGETVDDLLKGIMGGIGGPASNPPPQSLPAPHLAPAPSQTANPDTAPSQPSKQGPGGPVPSQARRSSTAPRGASSPRRNGTPKGPSPPASAMRDALVDTFAPPGSSPPPMDRHQLLDSLVRLLQTNQQFGDDVYRAYSARTH